MEPKTGVLFRKKIKINKNVSAIAPEFFIKPSWILFFIRSCKPFFRKYIHIKYAGLCDLLLKRSLSSLCARFYMGGIYYIIYKRGRERDAPNITALREFPKLFGKLAGEILNL